MALNRVIREGDNPELTEERLKATFDTDQMAAVIWGSNEFLQRRREISKKLENYPQLADPTSLAFLTRPEKIDLAAKKITEMLKVAPEIINITDPMELHALVSEVVGLEGHPLALHGVMFLPAIQAQAADDQQEWLSKALSRAVIGTYAQTELGHGTNLRKLETTATYDKSTQEFIMNSPTITSMKWWPGNLGKSSNHAVVAATLYIDGKNLGPHNFIVQLRDEQTHMPRKGITVGDIGPKMAYNGTDNGFLRFDHVRIPRSNMLMRHAKVAADGTYTKPAHPKMGYSAMVHVRSHMIVHQAHFLAQTLTSAIRYSGIRRQGEIKEGAGEVKIMEYQTQQHRLFPSLARAFAIHFAGVNVRNLYLKVSKDMKSGETTHLADLHAITSGLKAVVTFQCGEGMEQARMSCGGHGYSMAGNFSEVYGTAIGGCTYEGENMVMLLQLARYLVKAAKKAQQGAQMGSTLAYLQKPTKRHSPINARSNASGSTDYSAHIEAFEHMARNQVFKAANRLEKLVKSGMSPEEAWNANGVELNRAARLHTRLFIAQSFCDSVAAVVDARVKDVLTDLLHLHLDYELIDAAYYLMGDEYLSADQLDWLKEDMYRLLAKIRPNAVSLVDSWDITDRELRSVLGRRDGHVYPNLFKWARESQLNKEEVLPTFHKYLKPMMDSGRQLISKL